MKKTYSKPLVSVEVLTLDQPIAASCTADPEVIRDLMEFNYFMDGKGCMFNLLPTGGFDENRDGVADHHDTVCYHSNIQTAFLS